MSYRIDPELAPFVDLVPASDFGDPVAARAGMEAMIAAFNAHIDASGLHIENRHIPGPAGAPEVPVRIYRPSSQAGTSAGLLYIHGGGFVVGSPDTEHGSAVRLAKALGIVLVSVDYRLAPEAPYPAGLEDCYAALQWFHTNADALGVDSQRIGIFGQSAGGGLSAALALLARDRKGPAICYQFLGMPELDDRLETVSMRNFTDTPLWNRPNAILSWQFYLGDHFTPGADNVPAYAAPARATDLSNLPPAFVTAMEFDPLRDEDVIYALKMLEAGVPVELHTYPGTFHGSSLATEAAVSKRMETEMIEALRRGLQV